MSLGKLFLVPTPIGNLGDITDRAKVVLNEVDKILAEDTRTSGKLLQHLGIAKPLIAFHAHNEHHKTDMVIDHLKQGEILALVSDAGTPGISDPGYLLVQSCVANGIEVEVLTGAVAFIPAVVASGLPCNSFFFNGFLPHKKGRIKRLSYLAELEDTLVFYESPHRIVKSLEQMLEAFGDRKASVSREITKKFEEHKRGSLSELLNHFKNNAPKGEFVICVAGKN
ncbi:16S rRNA (cytidine(1402)-2'-O)-methyltransferase [Luteibaculum oceani]|uniref:Ribosomal RNA small subunit methyltransferase I n=1 Tax=Luteibaculum oceani TaxID=1294296 RepID=A0A5C6V2C3_9FLAO|nr:16S rRNA (cytidine(1402)-2'-O)-methyltransferase [Luteibaculum oceani]TXC79000.1 16S rRNA (cytidine(1402)-2'-O)-methyltransferase [Luteibaculum oceani]